MNREDLIGQVVAAESPVMFSVLFPRFRFESEMQAYAAHPVIYTGPVTSRIIDAMRLRAVPFVAVVPAGGALTLTRSDLFHMVNRTRRLFKPAWNNLPVDEFINGMRILSICGKVVFKDLEFLLFPVFVELSKRGHQAVGLALEQAEDLDPLSVLKGLITFFQRVCRRADGDLDAVSGQYAVVLERAARRGRYYKRALAGLAYIDALDSRMAIIYLIISVLGD